MSADNETVNTIVEEAVLAETDEATTPKPEVGAPDICALFRPRSVYFTKVASLNVPTKLI